MFAVVSSPRTMAALRPERSSPAAASVPQSPLPDLNTARSGDPIQLAARWPGWRPGGCATGEMVEMIFKGEPLSCGCGRWVTSPPPTLIDARCRAYKRADGTSARRHPHCPRAAAATTSPTRRQAVRRTPAIAPLAPWFWRLTFNSGGALQQRRLVVASAHLTAVRARSMVWRATRQERLGGRKVDACLVTGGAGFIGAHSHRLQLRCLRCAPRRFRSSGDPANLRPASTLLRGDVRDAHLYRCCCTR